MAKTILYTGLAVTHGAASTNYFLVPTGRIHSDTTEDRRYVLFREAGTFSNLFVRVRTNTLTGTCVYTFRKNSTPGNLTLTINAGATGIFEDTTHTDTIVAGDKVALQMVSGAGTNINTSIHSVLFDATTSTVSRFAVIGSSTTATTTSYYALTGASSIGDTTENNTKTEMQRGGTFRYLYVRVRTNSKAGNTPVRLRINGANATNVITIGSSATGDFEDTTHNDVVAAGDDVNLAYETSVAGTQVINLFSMGFVTTTNLGYIHGSPMAAVTQAEPLTRYYHLGGIVDTGVTAEADVQLKTRTPLIFSNLTIHISANAITGTSTFKTRVNTADGFGLCSITSSATGYFTDATNWDECDADDLVNYQLITPTVGGTPTLTVRSVAVITEPFAALTRVEKANTFKYHIIGRVSEQTTYKYHVIGRTSKQNTLRYNILTRASKLNTLRYNIIGRVQKPNTLRYNIIGRVSKPNTFKYNIKVKVSKANTFLYNIRLRVSKPNTLRYSILQRISKPTTLRYNIIGRVSKANTFLYRIVGRVSKPNTFRYNIFVQVKKLNTFKYNILSRVSKPNTFIYNILAALSRVSKPTTYKYNILGRTTKPTTYRYNVLQQAQKPTTYKYNILSKTSKPTTFKYNILQRVSKPNTFIYNLIAALARVQKINTFKYNIIARTQKPTTYRYNILQRVSKPNTFQYNILSRIQKTTTFRYNILSLVQKTTTYRYNIIGRISKTVSFLYNILAEEAVGGAGHFAGGGGISQKVRTFRPRQLTVPPRKVIAIIFVKSRREFSIAVIYTKTRLSVQVKRNFMPLKVAFAPLPIKETPTPKPRVFYTKSIGSFKAGSLLTKTRGTFNIKRLSTRYYLDEEAKFGMLRKLMKIYDMFRSL